MLLVLKMAEKEITSGSDEVAEILSCNDRLKPCLHYNF